MTIRKGAAWGRPGRLTDTQALWFDDTSAARAFHQALPDERFRMALAPGTDMATTLGITDGAQQAKVLAGEEATVVPIDLGIAMLDGGPPRPFLAHCVAHRSRRRLSSRPWRGRFVVAMNAAWHGDLYLAPKGHPNDGRLDVTDGSISTREWPEFRKRARTGSHLPHPELSAFAASSWTTEFDKPTMVWTDGVRMGWCRRLELQVIPDAGEIVI